MAKGFGLFCVAALSALAGAAATLYILKKREEEALEYEELDDDAFFEDCDCDCENCENSKECGMTEENKVAVEEINENDIPIAEINEEDVDEEVALDSVEEDISDLDKMEPTGNDF